MRKQYESLMFQRVSTLSGASIAIHTARQNGCSIPVFDPKLLLADIFAHQPDEDEYAETLAIVSEGLNCKQQETWRTILESDGCVFEAARRLNVTHPAIYFRIRGDKRTKGMIHENDYVAHWWKRRGHRN